MRKPKQANAWRGPGWTRLEAARYLGVCARTLDEWRALGTGPTHVRVGARVTYWPQDLDAFLVRTRRQNAVRQTPDRDAADLPCPSRRYSVEETCALLHVTRRTLTYWRQRHIGPTWIRDGRLVLYRGSDLLAYLQAKPATSAADDSVAPTAVSD